MNKELTICLNSLNFKAFLQNGFYPGHTPTSYVHRHNYSEIHIVSGDAVFAVGTETVTLKGGDSLAIPKRILHRCISISPGAEHTAFQTTLDISEIAVCSFANGTVDNFLFEINECENSGTYNKVCSYISLFVTPFVDAPTVKAENIRDYGFLINEFFSNRYGFDITLNDLAEILHVSPRHAERLVKEYTGNSFGKELTKARTEMASYLIKTTDMTLAEISRLVGYRSYAGFYKAMKSMK